MPFVASVDYPGRRIHLSADTLGADVHPVDIYREVRALRAQDLEAQKFRALISAQGNQPKTGSTFTPRRAVLAEDVRLVPFDVSHALRITGEIISTVEALEGADLFDRLPLASTTKVDIDYRPLQVEIIRVNVAGSDAGAIWDHAIGGGLVARDAVLGIFRALLNGARTTLEADGSFTVEILAEDGATVARRLSVTADGQARAVLP